MARYRINMARGQVVPIETRRRWRAAMLAYFVLVLIAVSWSVGAITKRILALGHEEARIKAAEDQFLSGRRGATAVAPYGHVLYREMTACASQLEAVDVFHRSKWRASGTLLGFAQVLPGGARLASVELDASAARIGLEIHVPVNLDLADSITPPYLISLWAADSLLAGKIGKVTAEKSERMRVGDDDVLIWRFSGTLRGDN